MIETKNENLLEEFHDLVSKFSKHVMVASIIALIIGAAISLFLLILRFPMVSLVIFSSTFCLFIGLISAEALLYKAMKDELPRRDEEATA